MLVVWLALVFLLFFFIHIHLYIYSFCTFLINSPFVSLLFFFILRFLSSIPEEVWGSYLYLSFTYFFSTRTQNYQIANRNKITKKINRVSCEIHSNCFSLSLVRCFRRTDSRRTPKTIGNYVVVIEAKQKYLTLFCSLYTHHSTYSEQWVFRLFLTRAFLHCYLVIKVISACFFPRCTMWCIFNTFYSVVVVLFFAFPVAVSKVHCRSYDDNTNNELSAHRTRGTKSKTKNGSFLHICVRRIRFSVFVSIDFTFAIRSNERINTRVTHINPKLYRQLKQNTTQIDTHFLSLLHSQNNGSPESVAHGIIQ